MNPKIRNHIRSWILDYPQDDTEIRVWLEEDGWWALEVGGKFMVATSPRELFQDLADLLGEV